MIYYKDIGVLDMLKKSAYSSDYLWHSHKRPLYIMKTKRQCLCIIIEIIVLWAVKSFRKRAKYIILLVTALLWDCPVPNCHGIIVNHTVYPYSPLLNRYSYKQYRYDWPCSQRKKICMCVCLYACLCACKPTCPILVLFWMNCYEKLPSKLNGNCERR